jgi:hypothetical protein
VERLHAWTEEQEPYRSPFVRSVDGADRGAERIVARASKKRPFRRQRCSAPLQSLSVRPLRGKGKGGLRRLKARDRTGSDCGDQRSSCTDAPARHRRRKRQPRRGCGPRRTQQRNRPGHRSRNAFCEVLLKIARREKRSRSVSHFGPAPLQAIAARGFR